MVISLEKICIWLKCKARAADLNAQVAGQWEDEGMTVGLFGVVGTVVDGGGNIWNMTRFQNSKPKNIVKQIKTSVTCENSH